MDLVADAARALGTTGTMETVHAALMEVVTRQRRVWLARRDFSDLLAAPHDLRATGAAEEPVRELDA